MLFPIIATASAALVLTLIVTILNLRRVVPTNEVHIVQSAKETRSYGKGTSFGNTYYEWPSWIPIIGIQKVKLPMSVFDLNLNNYEAYDKGRVPFVVDITAFFRVDNSNLAAQRVESFQELTTQLTSILQGAARTILASNEIETILESRGTFGDQFTQEVSEQLQSWGVVPVKNIELMDIRDAKDSKVIANIMEKQKSRIEMESRQAVADNNRVARVAEIEATRLTEIAKQEAEKQVGTATALKEKEIGLAIERSNQEVAVEAKKTAEKNMEIHRVQDVKRAEIDREVNVVKALQEKEVTVLKAEGDLEAQRRLAEGIQVEGNAKAEAEKAMQLAPVQAQITLAKEIGENQSYQQYLITIKNVEAQQAVGIEQAKNLSNADIKIISNAGDVQGGLNNLSDVFSTKGGLNISSMLEGLGTTEFGKQLLDKLTSKGANQ